MRQVPPTATGTVDFAKTSARLAITEQVSVYPDLSHAEHAEQLTEAGLACSDGTLSGGPSIKIKGPTDLSGALTAKVDKAEVWDVRSGSTEGALVHGAHSRSARALRVPRGEQQAPEAQRNTNPRDRDRQGT